MSTVIRFSASLTSVEVCEGGGEEGEGIGEPMSPEASCVSECVPCPTDTIVRPQSLLLYNTLQQ